MALEEPWSVQKLYFVGDALLITGHEIKSKLLTSLGHRPPTSHLKGLGKISRISPIPICYKFSIWGVIHFLSDIACV